MQAHDGVDELQTILELALSSMGPGGRLKLVQSVPSGGHVTVTSSSRRLFANARLDDPCARLVADLLRARRGSAADGGLLATVVAAGLVRDGRELRMPGYRLAAAIEQCVSWCDECALSGDAPLCASIGWEDQLRGPLALVRSVLAPKHGCLLSAPELEHISFLLVEAFVTAIPDGERAPNAPPPCVRTLPLLGMAPARSSVAEGAWLDVLPPSGAPESLPAGASVALFDVALTGAAPDDGIRREYAAVRAADADGAGRAGAESAAADAESGHADDSGSLAAEADSHALRVFAERMAALRVGLVASQKGIAPELQSLLLECGIAPLERLSLRHLSTVARVSGARVLSSLADAGDDAGALGVIGGLYTRQLGRRTLLELVPLPAADSRAPRAQPVTTVLLGARTASALDELQEAAATALNALALVVRDARVLPGGGCTEAALAHAVRQRALGTAGEHAALARGLSHPELRAAADVYASALERVPRALARDARAGELAGDDFLERMRACEHADGAQVVHWGWSADASAVRAVMRAEPAPRRTSSARGAGRRAVHRVTEALVIDHALTRMQALANGASVAMTVLNVDATLVVSSAASQ